MPGPTAGMPPYQVQVPSTSPITFGPPATMPFWIFIGLHLAVFLISLFVYSKFFNHPRMWVRVTAFIVALPIFSVWFVWILTLAAP